MNNDESKLKGQLIRELKEARIRIAELGQAVAVHERTEAAMSESIERFRSVLERSCNIIYSISLKPLGFHYISPSIKDVSGYTPDEIMSMGVEAWTAMVHPDDMHSVREGLARVEENGSGELVYRQRARNGEYRWLSDHLTLERDDSGRVLYREGIIRDITDRKHREANLSFLTEISQDLAGLYTEDDIIQTAGAKIGSFMNISKCLFEEINEHEDAFIIRSAWCSEEIPNKSRIHRISRFVTKDFRQAAHASETIVVRDTRTDPRTDCDAHSEFKIHAFVAVPFHYRAEWMYIFTIANSSARDWREDEIELIRETANRTVLRIEHVWREEALHMSEERYHSLFDSIDEGFCILQMIFDAMDRPVDYSFIEINPAFKKHTGMKNILGRTIKELAPDIEPLWCEAFGTVALTGDPVRFEDYAASMGRWFNVYAFRIGKPHERKVAVLLSDITKVKQAQEELVNERTSELERMYSEFKESEARYSFLTEKMSDFLWTVDADLNVTYISPAIEKIRGFTTEEILHESLTESMTPESYEKAMEIYRSELEKIRMKGIDPDRTIKIELELTCKDGSSVLTEHVIKGIYDKGKLIGMQGVGRDIAVRKKAEEEKKKLEDQLAQVQRIGAIDRFAGGIAHDLNDILYPIIINLEELLKDWPRGSSHHEILEQTLNAAHRQKDLVKKIRSFSRRGEQIRRPVRVKPLLDETIRFLKSSLPSKIEFRKNIKAKADTVMGDSVLIQQVIMNLCQNSAEAYPSEQGVIEIGLTNTKTRLSQDGQDARTVDYLKLTVKDAGIGMPPRVMDRIFEPFFTSKSFGKGHGMGLSVVYGIVKSHGGTITVESEEGKGSLFTVYLPILEEHVQDQAANTVRTPSVPGSEKILLIDDDNFLLSTLQRVLKASGYHVAAYTDSREAFHVFTKNPEEFDLVITDLSMPEMTGLDLARKLVGIRSNIPIVLCTGYNDVINQEEVRSLGIKELVLKPVGASELKKVIRRAIER